MIERRAGMLTDVPLIVVVFGDGGETNAERNFRKDARRAGMLTDALIVLVVGEMMLVKQITPKGICYDSPPCYLCRGIL